MQHFKGRAKINLCTQLSLSPPCKLVTVILVSAWHHARSKNFGYDGPFGHFLEVIASWGRTDNTSTEAYAP